MTMQFEACEPNDAGRSTLVQFLRRGLMSLIIVGLGIAILLGELWVIERSPPLFVVRKPTPSAERSFGAAIEGDATPIAVLH